MANTKITTDVIEDDAITAAKIAANSISANELNVSSNGTSGQFLSSDGDGSMTWSTVTQKSLGSWVTRSFATTYTATTDGFFVANATNGGAVYGGLSIVVDGTTVVQSRSTSEGASGWQTGMFPVRSGQTYRANLTGSGASALSAFFIPFS
jgi:hypothetical protein